MWRVAGFFLGCVLVFSAAGQAYPSKTLKIVVPFAPGGYTLLMATTGVWRKLVRERNIVVN